MRSLAHQSVLLEALLLFAVDVELDARLALEQQRTVPQQE